MLVRPNEILDMTRTKHSKDSFLCLAEVKVEGGRLVAIENKKGR